MKSYWYLFISIKFVRSWVGARKRLQHYCYGICYFSFSELPYYQLKNLNHFFVGKKILNVKWLVRILDYTLIKFNEKETTNWKLFWKQTLLNLWYKFFSKNFIYKITIYQMLENLFLSSAGIMYPVALLQIITYFI